MRKTKHSLFLLVLCAPLTLSAASRIEVPTSIQVTDVNGHTIITTSTLKSRMEVPRQAFVPPKACVTGTASIAGGPLMIPQGHPLRTRVESQRSVLASLVSQLSFGPHLARETESNLKASLLSLGVSPSTVASGTLACMTELDESASKWGGTGQQELVTRIEHVVTGLQYGLRTIKDGSPESPTTATEALYAGDMILAAHPHISSVAIANDSVEVQAILPVAILGRWKKDVVVRVHSDAKSVSVDAPWWIFLGTHDLKQLRGVLKDLPEQQEGVGGMFLRAEDMVDAINP